jgi:hypothetical protein
MVSLETRVEGDVDKRSSLLWYMSEKSFVVRAPGACIIKFITAVIYGFRSKLECLSLESLSSLASVQ